MAKQKPEGLLAKIEYLTRGSKKDTTYTPYQRTDQDILADLKKIDGAICRDELDAKPNLKPIAGKDDRENTFSYKTRPLMNEWIKKGYNLNNTFEFGGGPQFKCYKAGKESFPKEFTLVDWHILMGKENDMKLLIDKGLEPNVKDSKGRTTLMLIPQLAYFNTKEGMKEYAGRIEACVKIGIEKNAIDSKGNTALDYIFSKEGCKTRAEFEKSESPLKGSISGFLTGEEAKTKSLERSSNKIGNVADSTEVRKLGENLRSNTEKSETTNMNNINSSAIKAEHNTRANSR